MARLIVKSPYIKCGFYQRGDSLPQRTTPLEPQENARGKSLDPRTPNLDRIFGSSVLVFPKTIRSASISARPLLRRVSALPN